jgi:LytS/YehU family sensor histidine kinase
LKKRKFGVYLLEFLPLFALLIAGYVWLVRYQLADETQHRGFFFSERFVVSMTLNTLFLVIFVGVLRFAEDWFELEARKKELENERLTSELRFLKAQVNPHFLFNTLNNLYYLAFTQSPNTTEVIAKLSQMMRYMIYDSNTAEVPLEKEIEYMENYIALEKLRLNNEVPIAFDVEGDTAHVRIAPLILITFLENAFKHGVSGNTSEAWVRLKLVVEGSMLTYTVENSKAPVTAEIVKTGIGLQNVERRLALSYPGKFQLTVRDEENVYYVRLDLDLRDLS